MSEHKDAWTTWLENPGRKERPMPDWYEKCEVMFEDGTTDWGGFWEWQRTGHKKGGEITHYKYSIPRDLAWLAHSVPIWEHPEFGYISELSGSVVYQATATGMPRRPTYSRAQWHRARKDLGLLVAEQDSPTKAPGHEPTEEEEEAWRSKEVWQEIDLRTDDEIRQDEYDATAPGILNAALGHMQDRAATYDKPQGERSMKATVSAMQDVTGVAMTEEQGWLFMALLKAVRSQQGALRMDSYEDGAAYFGLAGEAAAKERGQ